MNLVMQKKIFFIVLCFSFFCGMAQDKTIDSLKKVLSTAVHDTSKLFALKQLVDASPDGEWEKYNQQMKAIAEKALTEKLLDKKVKRVISEFLSSALQNEGVTYARDMSDFLAMECYEKSAEISKEIGNEEALTETEMEIAKLHERQGNTTKAIDLYYKVLKNYEKNENFLGIGDVFSHIGAIYTTQKDFKLAHVFVDKAYQSFEKAGYNRGMYKALCRKAFIYTNENRLDEAFICFEKSTAVLDSTQKEEEAFYISDNLALVYLMQGKYEKAILQCKESLRIAQSKKQPMLIGHAYFRICDAYSQKGDNRNLIETGEIALKHIKEFKYLNGINQITSFLYKAYKEEGNYRKALEIYEQYVVSKDSLASKDIKQSMLEKELKYEFEKKELEAKNLSDKKIADLKLTTEIDKAKSTNLMFMLASIAFLFLVVSGFTFFYFKQKNIISNQKVNLFRQKMLLSQMNPHFIFNSINSIQNYVLNKNEDMAYNYLAKFSKLIRMVLNNSREDEITLDAELETLALYVELEQLRFDNKFSYDLNVSEDLNTFDIKIPAMLIQPYVENAILHGLMNLNEERKGKLKIEIQSENNLLKVSVEDNGIGREQSKQYKTESLHDPLAMKLTEERVEMINKLENAKNVKIVITDLYDAHQKASGTRVELFLPLTS